MPNKHIHFAGATSYMMWLEAQRTTNGILPSFDGDVGGPSVRYGINALLNGDEKHCSQAKALVDQITQHVEVPRTEWKRNVYGYFPDVTAYMRDEPECMWMPHTIKEEHTPLRIYFGLTSSAMIEESTLVKRGCALAAFAIAMANVRPITIVPFVTLGSTEYISRRGETRAAPRNMLISWEISTQPLIMSELMSVTLPEVTRYVGIEACRQMFGSIASDDCSFHKDSFSESKMRLHLGAKPDDLYLPCVYGLDPLVNDPITWVNTQIERYTTGDATDLASAPKEGEY